HAPTSVPRAVRFLGIDQILDRVTNAADFRIEIDVAEQLQGARGQIAAGRIKNRVMVRERHVLEPWRGDVLVECRPTAVAALETHLPVESAPKSAFQCGIFFRFYQ